MKLRKLTAKNKCKKGKIKNCQQEYNEYAMTKHLTYW